jgi:hypothetical protein
MHKKFNAVCGLCEQFRSQHDVVQDKHLRRYTRGGCAELLRSRKSWPITSTTVGDIYMCLHDLAWAAGATSSERLSSTPRNWYGEMFTQCCAGITSVDGKRSIMSTNPWATTFYIDWCKIKHCLMLDQPFGQAVSQPSTA